MYQRILLAFDGSREGWVALGEGVELAAACAADVHLLSVMELTGSSGFGEGIHPLETFDDGPVGHLRRLVDEAVVEVREAGVDDVQGHIAFGQPVEQIDRLARQIDADLIVVGHRSRGLLTWWWQGSLSHRLLDRVHCSVLVARHPEDEARR
ncbi:universal stress protein [Ectothiorhodospiraceae bacterium WFHF3C12]|nr:universal stress protein [Ectothiorhodospiraceae bacterium WFHF3C12]